MHRWTMILLSGAYSHYRFDIITTSDFAAIPHGERRGKSKLAGLAIFSSRVSFRLAAITLFRLAMLLVYLFAVHCGFVFRAYKN